MHHTVRVILVLATALSLTWACGDSGEDGTGNGSGGSADGGEGSGLGGEVGAGATNNTAGTVNTAGTANTAGAPAGVGGANQGMGGDSGLGGAGTGSMCSRTGVTCVQSVECCSGVCDPNTDQCAAGAIGECGVAGDACAVGTDCCTLACVGGKCSSAQCTSDGEACQKDGECCGGTCTANKCAPLNTGCGTSGNACSGSGDCCSNYCKDDVCSFPSFCVQVGDVCSSDLQCCGGLCQKKDGAALGTCATAPATGGGKCLSAGEACSGGEVYMGGDLPTCGGECCSRACFPYGPTGVLICQPPSGCRPTGEICREDADCCGSETLPDGDTAQITCNKAGNNPVGRCENGNACTPAGGICRLQTIECNANANCCSGNVLQHDTCKQDNLGIPRCLAAEIDCSDPQNFVGKECASSADCCNLPCVPDAQGVLHCGGSVCQRSGDACTTNADCCPGVLCIVPPGSTDGTCGDDPGGEGGAPNAGGAGPGAGGDGNTPGCSEYGQLCGGNADCCNAIPCTDGICRLPIE